jgi:hypothetical protein
VRNLGPNCLAWLTLCLNAGGFPGGTHELSSGQTDWNTKSTVLKVITQVLA